MMKLKTSTTIFAAVSQIQTRKHDFSISGGDRERFALSNVPRRVETGKKPALRV